MTPLLVPISLLILGTVRSVPLKKCPPPEILTVNSTELSDDYVQSEAEIAELRHFAGIVPTDYKIFLEFSDDKNFSGLLNLRFRVEEPTEKIQLNVDYSFLKVDLSSLSLGIDGACVSRVEMAEEKELLTLFLNQELYPKTKEHKLLVGFERIRNDGVLPGIGYGDEMGESWLLHTAFSFRAARMAFPNMDHPSLKATFKLTIRHPSDLAAASSTEIESISEESGGKFTETTFERTRKLSTYLLSFSLYRNMKAARRTTEAGVKLSILYPNWENLTDSNFTWALDQTEKIFADMEKMTGKKFPLKKLDFICIRPYGPEGLENDGLVSLHLDLMLNPNKTYSGNTGVILLTHEIVHHWVGNLFTPAYWYEGPLFEGLTVSLEILLNDRNGFGSSTQEREVERAPIIFSEFRKLRRTQMIAGAKTLPFKYYGDLGTDWVLHHYIRSPLIFLMLADMFTVEVFENLIRELSTRYALSNYSYKDIAKILEELSGKEAANIFKSWFLVGGHPVFVMKRSSDRAIQISKSRASQSGLVDSTFIEQAVPLVLEERGDETMRNISLWEYVPGYDSDTAYLTPAEEQNMVVMDKTRKTIAHTVYEAKDFTRIFEATDSQDSIDMRVDFYFAFKWNAFPIPDTPENIQDWRDLFANWTRGRYGAYLENLHGIACCFTDLLIQEGQSLALPDSCQDLSSCNQFKIYEVLKK